MPSKNLFLFQCAKKKMNNAIRNYHEAASCPIPQNNEDALLLETKTGQYYQEMVKLQEKFQEIMDKILENSNQNF